MMFGCCPKSPKITWKSWDYRDIGYMRRAYGRTAVIIPVWITIGKTIELIFI